MRKAMRKEEIEEIIRTFERRMKIAAVITIFLALAALLFAPPAPAQTTVAPFVTSQASIANLLVGIMNGTPSPAQCANSSAPSWCSGSTADAWIVAACNALPYQVGVPSPSQGGIVDLRGLSGNITATTRGCSTASRQVIFYADLTTRLTVTETDGDIAFPLASGSMFLGPPGAGHCGGPNYASSGNANGIRMASTANVAAVFGPAAVDGTEEDLTVEGVCLQGDAFGLATVTNGLIWLKNVYTNTTIANSNIYYCITACVTLENAGNVQIYNTEMNVAGGALAVTGSGLVIKSTTTPTGSTGCIGGNVNVWGADIEHAGGGANYPEISIHGNGMGGFPCSVHIHDLYIEKNIGPQPSIDAIDVNDCWNCTFDNIQENGGSGTPSGDLLHIAQTQIGRVQNVTAYNLSGGAPVNLVNDTTVSPTIGVLPNTPGTYGSVTSYVSHPGFQSAPALPQSTLQSLGADLMGGLGNFASGSGTYGTGFTQVGCNEQVSPIVVLCTYTRTNATAPPNLTYSQQINMTSDNDTSIGYYGITTTSNYSYTAGTQYAISMWAKSDGTFSGQASFQWSDFEANTVCNIAAPGYLTTTWTLYTFTCTPSSSGSLPLSFVAAQTPLTTGTYWIAGVNVAVIQPLTPGSLLQAVTPYGIGPATNVGVGLGNSFQTTHGSNATAGVVTLASGTATVSTTKIAALAAAGGAGAVVQLHLLSCSSCGTLSVGTVTAGTSFVINSTNASDASKVYWEIKTLN